MISIDSICIIVQARLGSSRLPKKVMMDLGGKPLLAHVLDSARQITAGHYIVACDYASISTLKPVASQYGFECIAGSEDDVLSRFALAIKKCNQQSKTPIKVIVRVTADNPFLFVPAMESSLRRFFELGEPDYFTFTGLPHGSGIEILKAETLLQTAETSDSSYEREHVGPSIYHHTDKFKCVRETAPVQWYHPDARTTVDTKEDYLKAKHIINFLDRHNIKLPAEPQQIMEAVNYADRLAVFIPSVSKGNGSGHLRRIIDLVKTLENKTRCEIYIESQQLPKFAEKLLKDINPELIINKLPNKAAIIVLDNFKTTADEMEKLKTIAPVVAIDEGGSGRANADYLLDILPSLISNLDVQNNFAESIQPNIFEPAFIPMPHKRIYTKKKVKQGKPVFLKPEKTKTLVVCGGEDAKHIALPVGQNLAKLGFDVTVIDPNISFNDIHNFDGEIKLSAGIPNLREKISHWDLVVTQYGFTAFEALAGGAYVVLISPTNYHYQLATITGFSALPESIPTPKAFADMFSQGIKIPKIITPLTQQKNLANLIEQLTFSHSYKCPVCDFETNTTDSIVARLPDRTIRKCPECQMHYLSFIMAEPKKYTKNYFFDEYKAQYGKTYLEDFNSIREQGLRRIDIIDKLYDKIFHKKTDYNIFSFEKKILDVGCAYGPFVHAAKSKGWFAVGTDISESAVNYVSTDLNIPAFVSAFPALPQSFSYKYYRQVIAKDVQRITVPLNQQSFSAVSMWFVIEHFSDLDAVLRKVSELLIPGGIFAFSTPTLSGVTGKQKPRKFFQDSPKDHYTLWDNTSIHSVLEKYGFRVCKIVSIGHHPERFKGFEKIKHNGITWSALNQISRSLKLGDSVEVYAMKRGTLEDVN